MNVLQKKYWYAIVRELCGGYNSGMSRVHQKNKKDEKDLNLKNHKEVVLTFFF